MQFVVSFHPSLRCTFVVHVESNFAHLIAIIIGANSTNFAKSFILYYTKTTHYQALHECVRVREFCIEKGKSSNHISYYMTE